MKHIMLYEDFFSILSKKYVDILAVNIEIGSILHNLIKHNRFFNVHEGEHGGWTISDNHHKYTYKVINFNQDNQISDIAVNDGSILLTTLQNIESNELKRTIQNDAKNRFNNTL